MIRNCHQILESLEISRLKGFSGHKRKYRSKQGTPDSTMKRNEWLRILAHSYIREVDRIRVKVESLVQWGRPGKGGKQLPKLNEQLE